MNFNNSNEQVIGETGIVSDFNHNSQTIFFEQKYENPVIFAQPLSYNGSQPGIIRIENVKSDRFTAFLQEPSNLDMFHAKESFSYMVLEAGTWQLDNDTVLEVDTVKTDLLGNEGWENISFSQNFKEDPLVFSQVQTNNDSDFVVTRQKNSTSEGFELTMQEEEALMYSGHGAETVGWMAISAGNGNWSSNKYQAGTTGNNVIDQWHTVKFDKSLDSPILLASIATYNGADTSTLRSTNLNSDRVDLKIKEETSKDSETYHAQEEVNFLAIDGRNSLLYGSQVRDNYYAIGETGTVSNFNQNRKTIFFEQKYENPVIFTQPLSYKDWNPAIIRIEDIKSDRFTAFLQEPGNLDQKHSKESFSYLVLEEGTWQLDNNTILEVDTVTTDLLKNKGWGNINFTQNFSEDPLVFSQVQTNNDSDFVLTRQKNASSRGFELTIQEEQALMNSGHGSETVGWMAISAGSGDWSENKYQAGTTGNSVTDKWHTIKFDHSYESPIFLASIATTYGSDPSGLRLTNLDSSQVELKIEEETSADLETYHGREEVNFLTIDGTNNLLYGSQVDEKFYYESSQKDTIHVKSYNSQPYTIGSYYSTVWTSDVFEGNFHRRVRGDAGHFLIDLEAKKGGFDTAIVQLNSPIKVDDIDSKTTFSSTIDVSLDGSGEWWVGPKFSVKSDITQGLHKSYENYVVENASISSSLYHKRLSKMGTYLGQTFHDGSIYKHYYNKHNTWGQFWAIRQDYRDTGSVSLKPILNTWRNNGLPNKYLSDLRTNIETHGELRGTVEMSNMDITML